MTPFTRRMFYLGHALTGDRADQRRAGQDASAGSSWELFLKDFGAKNHEKASQRARASCLGLDRVGVSNRAEPAENRRAQRRHRLGRHTRNPVSESHGRLRSGVDLFGRASRSRISGPITWKLLHFSPQPKAVH